VTRELLGSVLGCNLAWGLINALMFVMDRVVERSRVARMVEAVRGAPNEEQGLALIRDELEPKLRAVCSWEERECLYQAIFRNIKNAAVPKTMVQREEIGGALVTFLVVVLTAVPAIVPFLFLGNLSVALRVSNGLLLGLLFLVGYCWARQTKVNPWLTGLGVMLHGAAVVGVAKALGG
jgi:VIT1/CCC1 family predicted Fe2+/Mn2+ transporter